MLPEPQKTFAQEFREFRAQNDEARQEEAPKGKARKGYWKVFISKGTGKSNWVGTGGVLRMPGFLGLPLELQAEAGAAWELSRGVAAAEMKAGRPAVIWVPQSNSCGAWLQWARRLMTWAQRWKHIIAAGEEDVRGKGEGKGSGRGKSDGVGRGAGGCGTGGGNKGRGASGGKPEGSGSRGSAGSGKGKVMGKRGGAVRLHRLHRACSSSSRVDVTDRSSSRSRTPTGSRTAGGGKEGGGAVRSEGNGAGRVGVDTDMVGDGEGKGGGDAGMVGGGEGGVVGVGNKGGHIEALERRRGARMADTAEGQSTPLEAAVVAVTTDPGDVRVPMPIRGGPNDPTHDNDDDDIGGKGEGGDINGNGKGSGIVGNGKGEGGDIGVNGKGKGEGNGMGTSVGTCKGTCMGRHVLALARAQARDARAQATGVGTGMGTGIGKGHKARVNIGNGMAAAKAQTRRMAAAKARAGNGTDGKGKGAGQGTAKVQAMTAKAKKKWAKAKARALETRNERVARRMKAWYDSGIQAGAAGSDPSSESDSSGPDSESESMS